MSDNNEPSFLVSGNCQLQSLLKVSKVVSIVPTSMFLHSNMYSHFMFSCIYVMMYLRCIYGVE